MSLVVGTNSWASLAEANTYLTDRIYASDWFAQPDTPASPGGLSKESLLISAFYWISGSEEFSIDPTVVSDDVKNAQTEAALYLLNHYVELDKRRAAISQGVTSFKYSKRSENYNINNLKIPSYIAGMIAVYQTGNDFVELSGEYDI